MFSPSFSHHSVSCSEAYYLDDDLYCPLSDMATVADTSKAVMAPRPLDLYVSEAHVRLKDLSSLLSLRSVCFPHLHLFVFRSSS